MYFKALLISIFSDICKIQLLIPALASLKFQKVMILISLIGLATSGQLRDNVKKSLLRTPQGRAFLFFSFWVLLSVPLSVYPGGAFTFVTEEYWKLIVMFCLVSAYGASSEAFGRMIWAIILATAIFAIQAFFAESGERFSMVETYDANENALVFVVFLPLILWEAVAQRGWKKVALIGLVALSVVGIIRTDSRGGFLGLAAVLALMLFQYRRLYSFSLAKIVVMAAAIVVVVVIQGGSEFRERWFSIFDTEGNYNYTAETGRIAIWKHGMEMMFANPILGVGADQFISAQGMTFRSGGGKWQAAHNSFIQVGAELGIPGLITYLFMVGSSLHCLKTIGAMPIEWKNRHRDLIIKAYSLTGSWVGFIVCGFFLSFAYGNVPFLLLGLTVALVNVVRAQDEAPLNGV